MILIHVMGGLGNQLYQYALYEKLKSLGKTVKLDLYAYTDATGDDREWRKLELDRFEGLDYEVATQKERMALLDNRMKIWDRVRRKLCGRQNKTVKETAEYMPEIFDMDDVYLYGFWECERYYHDILEHLRTKIVFPRSDNPKNIQCMKQMETENAVSVHIRRKDYLTVADGARYMGICTERYYEGAMRYIAQRVADPIYYIFSDDIEYVKKHYQGNTIRIVDWNDGDNSLFDMQLMSQCKHHICANSTFSMWGARLNSKPDKLMLRPLRHDNYEKIVIQKRLCDWENWIFLDENGDVCERE